MYTTYTLINGSLLITLGGSYSAPVAPRALADIVGDGPVFTTVVTVGSVNKASFCRICHSTTVSALQYGRVSD